MVSYTYAPLLKKVMAALMSASALLGMASCGSDGSSQSSFIVGGLFPETGSLSYFGPPEIAAFTLAINDINSAGGVLGNKVKSVKADVNDADHADQNISGTESVLSRNPSVIVGNPSSGVVKNTYKTIASAQVPMISVGATATSLSGISPYFFRTVPPDSVQGTVLANTIVQNGVSKLAIAVFNDEAGNGIRDVVVKNVEKNGVDVVYGEKDSFDPTETNFDSLSTTIKATNPDAVLVIAFDQTVALVKDLVAAGIDSKTLYFFDGNTTDYSSKFEKNLLKGDQGTIPGAHASAEFQARLKSITPSLTSFTYSAETYDAVVLAALAAQKGGGTSGKTIRDNLSKVSVSSGEKCTTYKKCLSLMKAGKKILYQGQSGVGPFNSKNDPSSAYIGVYRFDSNNKPVFDHSEKGRPE